MSVRIANGAGFWGDYPDATARLLEAGEFDYLQLEYLAEVTMGVLARIQESNPDKGYASDFTRFVINPHLETLLERDVQVVTNAGGINPEGCARQIEDIAAEQGLNVTIATVTGDNITETLEAIDAAASLRSIDTDEPMDAIRDSVVTAVAYLGAFPVAEALATGADIVITGRIVDPALTLGPLIHEYGWGREEYDLLASGIVAGHLIECGTQVTGGNFLGNWRELDFENLGYPIADVTPDGEVTITKPPGTGGRVSTETVKEQLLYEIGDPAAYKTPDVQADFTSPTLTQVDADAVRLSGATGHERPDRYKATVHYENGYKLNGKLLYSRPNALEKARSAAALLEQRIERQELNIEATNAEFVGHDATHGPAAPVRAEYNEILLRFAARSQDKQALRRLGMEFAPLSMAGPPSVTGLTDGGRPSPQPIIDTWPTLVPRPFVTPEVRVYE
ncbi:acyclic terpene utilization AtuA family protein [Salinigranum halophilum]|uniref:acyclic terpene utilization AtuA family protein n=1 Tax=Salinigranum halophilum TaxID=2565931 RepID=UPI0010A923EA|nr:acyclic terpene utilization AtuA family protein [Salinigranum halophilum]